MKSNKEKNNRQRGSLGLEATLYIRWLDSFKIKRNPILFCQLQTKKKRERKKSKFVQAKTYNVYISLTSLTMFD